MSERWSDGAMDVAGRTEGEGEREGQGWVRTVVLGCVGAGFVRWVGRLWAKRSTMSMPCVIDNSHSYLSLYTYCTPCRSSSTNTPPKRKSAYSAGTFFFTTTARRRLPPPSALQTQYFETASRAALAQGCPARDRHSSTDRDPHCRCIHPLQLRWPMAAAGRRPQSLSFAAAPQGLVAT